MKIMKPKMWVYALVICVLLLFLSLSTTIMMGNMFILPGEIIIASLYGIFIFFALWLLTKFFMMMQEKFPIKQDRIVAHFIHKYFLVFVIFVMHIIYVVINWVFHSYMIGMWIPDGLLIFQFVLLIFLYVKERSLKSITNSIWILYFIHLVSYSALGFSFYFVLSSILG
jgi:hypothetical protein